MNADQRILIAADDESFATHLKDSLKKMGYTVSAFVSDWREAEEIAGDARPDVALVDVALLGDAAGPGVADLLNRGLDVPVVYMTDVAEGDLFERAHAANPYTYVLRPFDARQLHLSIQAVVSIHNKELERRKARFRLARKVDEYRNRAELMETVFNSMSEGVVAIDEDGAILFHNSSGPRIAGAHPPEQDISKWPRKFGIFQPDGKTVLSADMNPLILAMKGQPTEETELSIRNEQRPEGVHISVSARHLEDKTGSPKGAVAVIRDITRLKRAEAELERSIARQQSQAQLMETVFNSMSEGVVAVDENRQVIFANSSAKRIAGDYPPAADAGKWAERYGVYQADGKTPFPLDRNPLHSALRGEPVDEVEAFIRNDQKPEGVHIRVSSRPLIRESGVSKGAVLVFRDVTWQTRAAAELETTIRELRNQSELMETTFKSISDGIAVADSAGKFLYVNPGAQQIIGMEFTDVRPDEWAEKCGAYCPNRETPMKAEDLPLLRAIHRGEFTDEEDVFIRNDRKPEGAYIRMSARPLLDNMGEIRGGVVIFRDVTERVLAEEALARAFDQGRLEMVDTILHNIGNAMNSVTTGIETVRRNLSNDRAGRRLFALASAIDAHRNDWIDYIANDPQGRKVMPFIIKLAEDFGRRNDELMKTVSRVRDRANRIADIVRTQKALDGSDMDSKDIDLYDALAGSLRVLRESLARRGIRTDVNCEDAPQQIRVRESQFHQMLVNLVKNSIEAIDEHAVLFGLQETPSIRIRASALDGYLNIEVIDNGIGIEYNDTRVLFTPGYTTKKSGSGLGLHSAANFVIASGGRIEPSSTGKGNGTTMRVMLPLTAVAPRLETG